MDLAQLREDDGALDDVSLEQLEAEVEALEMKVRRARAKDDLEYTVKMRAQASPFETETEAVYARAPLYMISGFC